MLMHTHMHTVPVTTDRCPCRTQPACYGGGRAAAAAAAVEEAAVAAGEKEKGYEKGYTRDGQARERQGERER